MRVFFFSRELARQQGRVGKGLLQEQEAIPGQDARLRDGRARGQGQDVRGGVQRQVVE